VTYTLEPTFMKLMAVQLFFSCYAILIELTVPTALLAHSLIVIDSASAATPD